MDDDLRVRRRRYYHDEQQQQPSDGRQTGRWVVEGDNTSLNYSIFQEEQLQRQRLAIPPAPAEARRTSSEELRSKTNLHHHHPHNPAATTTDNNQQMSMAIARARTLSPHRRRRRAPANRNLQCSAFQAPQQQNHPMRGGNNTDKKKEPPPVPLPVVVLEDDDGVSIGDDTISTVTGFSNASKAFGYGYNGNRIPGAMRPTFPTAAVTGNEGFQHEASPRSLYPTRSFTDSVVDVAPARHGNNDTKIRQSPISPTRQKEIAMHLQQIRIMNEIRKGETPPPTTTPARNNYAATRIKQAHTTTTNNVVDSRVDLDQIRILESIYNNDNNSYTSKKQQQQNLSPKLPQRKASDYGMQLAFESSSAASSSSRDGRLLQERQSSDGHNNLKNHYKQLGQIHEFPQQGPMQNDDNRSNLTHYDQASSASSSLSSAPQQQQRKLPPPRNNSDIEMELAMELSRQESSVESDIRLQLLEQTQSIPGKGDSSINNDWNNSSSQGSGLGFQSLPSNRSSEMEIQLAMQLSMNETGQQQQHQSTIHNNDERKNSETEMQLAMQISREEQQQRPLRDDSEREMNLALQESLMMEENKRHEPGPDFRQQQQQHSMEVQLAIQLSRLEMENNSLKQKQAENWEIQQAIAASIIAEEQNAHTTARQQQQDDYNNNCNGIAAASDDELQLALALSRNDNNHQKFANKKNPYQQPTNLNQNYSNAVVRQEENNAMSAEEEKELALEISKSANPTEILLALELSKQKRNSGNSMP